MKGDNEYEGIFKGCKDPIKLIWVMVVIATGVGIILDILEK